MIDTQQLRTLRFAMFMFLLPGLAGLLVSAVLATRYVENLPRLPIPSEMRMTPRNIHGVVVYETPEEHRRFTAIEHASTAVFVVGIALGLVYLRKWGIAAAISAEQDEYAEEPS